MELLRKAGKRINKEISDFDAVQNNMRQIGTPYLVGVMNDYDLLPSHNYKFGAVADSKQSPGIYGRVNLIYLLRMAAGMVVH